MFPLVNGFDLFQLMVISVTLPWT